MAKYICLNCNKEYISRKKNSKFCSIECKHQYNQINYNCDYCGKHIVVYRNKYEKLLSGDKKGIYCSKECADKAHTHRVTNICKNCGQEYEICRAFGDIQQFCSKDCLYEYKKIHSKERIVECKYCGKIFKTRHPNQKYCSYDCSGKAQRNRSICICDNCGKQFERIKSEVNKTKRHYCSKECKIEAMHWNEHDLNILRKYYNKIDIKDVQSILSKNWSLKAIRAKSQILGLGKNRKWSNEEIELFKKVYPIKSLNDVLKLFPNRTETSLLHQGQILGITSKFYNDRTYTDEELQFYIDNYLTMSDQELFEKFHRHTPYGIHQKLYNLGYKRPYEIKKDGYTKLQEFVRSRLRMWSKEVREYYNYTCCLTGSRSNIVVHHCRGFSLLFDETIELLNFEIKDNFIEYTDEELITFTNKFLEIQEYYNAYVCITESVHKLFHKIYGYGDNTVEQWNEFVSDYKNNKYKNVA